MQLTHTTTSFKQVKFPITLVCDNVNNAPNIGSLFRVCDAFGVSEIIFSGTSINIPSRKMQKTSRATEKYVPFKHINDLDEYLQSLKESYQIIALEITKNSNPIQSYLFNFDKPIILVIGDENFGVSDKVLDVSTNILHINMFGQNSSMNVVQAANIALYEITKQYH